MDYETMGPWAQTWTQLVANKKEINSLKKQNKL